MSTDFTPGTQFQFSVSCLDLITDAVRNALPVQQATFPKQWATQVIQEPPPAAKQTQRPVAHQMPTVPPPAGWGTSPQRQQGGQQGLPRKPPPEDIHHPKIMAMMDPYLAKYNNYIFLLEILTVSSKRITDLPTLPSYTTPTGSSGICWNTVLGRCFKGKRCRYNKGLVQKADMTDEFANAVTDCIGKGVLYYTNLPQGGSPDKKRSALDGPADDA